VLAVLNVSTRFVVIMLACSAAAGQTALKPVVSSPISSQPTSTDIRHLDSKIVIPRGRKTRTEKSVRTLPLPMAESDRQSPSVKPIVQTQATKPLSLSEVGGFSGISADKNPRSIIPPDANGAAGPKH